MGRTGKRKSQADDSSWSFLRLIIKVRVSQFLRTARAKAIPMMMFHCTEIITLYLLPPCLHRFANCSTRFFRSLIFRHTAKILFCNLFFPPRFAPTLDGRSRLFSNSSSGSTSFSSYCILSNITNFSLRNFPRHCFAHQCAHFPIRFSHIIISSFVFIFCCCALDDEWASHLIL